MNVTILSQTFEERNRAKLWMKEQYAEYPDGSIVSSCFAEKPYYVTGYIVIDQAKLKPEKKKLIKII